LIIQYLAFSFA